MGELGFTSGLCDLYENCVGLSEFRRNNISLLEDSVPYMGAHNNQVEVVS